MWVHGWADLWGCVWLSWSLDGSRGTAVWSLGLSVTTALMRSSAIFWVVRLMLMLSLYFLTLLYSTVSGPEQRFDRFFCGNT